MPRAGTMPFHRDRRRLPGSVHCGSIVEECRRVAVLRGLASCWGPIPARCVCARRQPHPDRVHGRGGAGRGGQRRGHGRRLAARPMPDPQQHAIVQHIYALYAKCSYYVILYMQSALLIYCFICNVSLLRSALYAKCAVAVAQAGGWGIHPHDRHRAHAPALGLLPIHLKRFPRTW